MITIHSNGQEGATVGQHYRQFTLRWNRLFSIFIATMLQTKFKSIEIFTKIKLILNDFGDVLKTCAFGIFLPSIAIIIISQLGHPRLSPYNIFISQVFVFRPTCCLSFIDPQQSIERKEADTYVNTVEYRVERWVFDCLSVGRSHDCSQPS